MEHQHEKFSGYIYRKTSVGENFDVLGGKWLFMVKILL